MAPDKPFELQDIPDDLYPDNDLSFTIPSEVHIHVHPTLIVQTNVNTNQHSYKGFNVCGVDNMFESSSVGASHTKSTGQCLRCGQQGVDNACVDTCTKSKSYSSTLKRNRLREENPLRRSI